MIINDKFILRNGPFDIQGRGAGIFLKKIVCFPTGAKKINVFNEVKNKKFSSFSVFFEAFFHGSYKGLQITQNLTCIKHVDLLLARSVLNVKK